MALDVPARNRIIAGISGMTVVVGAAKCSGSIVTADFAAAYGRDLGAVPGLVNSRASAGTNELTGEGKKCRVYVPEPVAEDLDLWRPHSPEVFIFGRAVDGQPWTKTDYDNWRSRALRKRKDGSKFRQRCFKAAAEDLGLGSDLKPYDLRHTFATLAAHAGWTEDEIAFQLGNSTEVVNEIYRHLLDAAPRPERQRLSIDDYIRQARGTLPAPARELVKA